MIKKLFLIFLFSVAVISKGNAAVLSDDTVIKMMDDALKALPEAVKKLPNDIRRVSFYALKVDRKDISQALFKQVQGKIEAAFLKVERPTLVYAPEIKPIKIVSKDDTITFTSGFQSTSEIKEIARKLRLDGMLEGELLLTKNAVYLNLRIFDTESLGIVWSEEFSSLLPPEPQITWNKLGFGLAGIPISKGIGGADIHLPDFTKYYSVEYKILNRAVFSDRAKYVLSAGLLYLYEGIHSSTPTIISKEKDGLGTVGFCLKAGMRLVIYSSKINRAGLMRDWLCVEFNLGRIFGLGTSGFNFAGVEIESEVTKDLSFAIAINYVPSAEIEYASNATAKVGGLMYEISVLRFNFD